MRTLSYVKRTGTVRRKSRGAIARAPGPVGLPVLMGNRAFTRHVVGASDLQTPARPSEASGQSGLEAAGAAPVQRRVRLTQPPAPPAILGRSERRAFVRTVFPAGRKRNLAYTVMEDMAAASNILEFQTPAELRAELVKRVTMSTVMQESQQAVGGKKAFGYPFTRPSLYWGPRVNFAAESFWEPAVVDGYDLRRNPAKRRQIRSLPRKERHTVFGDPPKPYKFLLTPAGRSDAYNAILQLFVPQAPHKRSLIHCDYLVSLVHFRALMETMGRTAFNARIAGYGPAKIVLQYDLFSDLEPIVTRSGQPSRPGLGTNQKVIPLSPADLVIGDHVYFWNHPSYDIINKKIGNAWRLENAVLISKQQGSDIFLGHGSGRKSDIQMRNKLKSEYNEVAINALRLVQRTRQGTSAQRASARTKLRDDFGVVDVGGTWRIRGTGALSVSVDVPLKLLRASDLPGLYDPRHFNPQARDTSTMYPVRRPTESA